MYIDESNLKEFQRQIEINQCKVNVIKYRKRLVKVLDKIVFYFTGEHQEQYLKENERFTEDFMFIFSEKYDEYMDDYVYYFYNSIYTNIIQNLEWWLDTYMNLPEYSHVSFNRKTIDRIKFLTKQINNNYKTINKIERQIKNER